VLRKHAALQAVRLRFDKNGTVALSAAPPASPAGWKACDLAGKNACARPKIAALCFRHFSL